MKKKKVEGIVRNEDMDSYLWIWEQIEPQHPADPFQLYPSPALYIYEYENGDMNEATLYIKQEISFYKILVMKIEVNQQVVTNQKR